jgi:hypothetical protein
MKRLFATALIALLLGIGAFAQSPIIVQPANAPVAAPQKPPAQTTKTDDTDLVGAVKSLQEIKAANEELLRKQQAALEALDGIQKEADQLRVYTKRS